YKWTADATGIDAGGACTFDDDTKANAKVTCTDDSNAGTFSLTLAVSDDDGGAGSSSSTLKVANVKPTIASLTRPDGTPLPTTVIVAGTLSIRTTFSDPASNDTHGAEIDCGTGTYTPIASSVTSPFAAACTFATVGPKTISVRVTDDDGGYDIATHSITVKYNFDGFNAPVDRPNTMNVSKAGQAIPLKWRLTDANGAPVTNVVAVTIRAKDQSCAAGTTTDLLEEYASGASGLQNLGNGNYQFNWKTPAIYAGSCKSIELVFGAGGLSYVDGPHAFFSFKK
ncbi:MAG: PxKF domain-containing protein, partial [Gemmatimonadales bacterium]|nr:PxKF domain-containing protein [Gemmatimonadales bacterium]